MKNLDWQSVVEQLISFTTAEVSKDLLSQISPCKSEVQVKNSYSNIINVKKVIDLGLRPSMESLDFYALWKRRLEKNATLKTIELKDIRAFCIEATNLKEVFNQVELNELAAQIMPAEEPLSAIEQIITYSGEIKKDASETLYNLFKEKKNLTLKVQNSLDGLVKKHELEPVLQDRYVTNREGRWVLPIKSGMQGKFQGIIHASSQSKQTVFMEPQEIIPSNNRIRQIEVDISEEIESLLKDLSDYLYTMDSDFESSYRLMLETDQWLAKAQLANKLNANPCEFNNESVNLKNLKHPILVIGNPSAVIGNDVELNPDRRILILSGPNAGGKTVLLKSIGLASHMARCGLFICCDPDSHLPFFSDIYSGVGDSQSVDENLSTFAAHLKILDNATKANGPKNLILIDEICGSTDPEEGGALAKSFIEEYAKNKCYGVITSHLGALKSDWKENSGVISASMDYHSESGPSYELILGVSGKSLAIQTAKKIGVSEEIIKNALDKLSPEYKKLHDNIESIEKIRDQLSTARNILAEKEKEANKKKSQYEAKLLNIEKEKQSILDKFMADAEAKISQTIAEKSVSNTFKKHETLEEIKKGMPIIIKDTGPTQPTTPDEFSKKFPPGSKVFISHLNQDGLVQGQPNKRGEIEVLSKSMRLMLPWKDLKAPHTGTNTSKVLINNKSLKSQITAAFDNSIDVRGHTVEEALKELDRMLDKASLAGESRIKILHGHGKETLKRSIRGYLSRSLYIKSWKAGSQTSGGDGVTWAEL